MIKTLIFDLGRVLIPFDFERGYSQISALTGETSEQIRTRIGGTGLVPKLESGQIHPHDFVREVTCAVGCPMDYAQFSEIWGSIFLPNPLIPQEYIAALKERYRLLILSNTNAIHCEHLFGKYAILDLFHHRILSHEVGAMKPDERIFQAALRHAEAAPGECFFTDDVPAYVEAAQRLGINAVVFESADKLRQDLESLGVVV